MERQKFEDNYLLALLSSVVNQKQVPVITRRLDWDYLFRVSSYHNVANLVNYGVLGADDSSVIPWKGRFFERYKDAVIQTERLERTELTLLYEMENREIHCAILDGIELSDCYPMREMRRSDSLHILIEADQIGHVRRLMEAMEYEEEKGENPEIRTFKKVPGTDIIFYESIPFTSKKMQRYFAQMLYRLPYMDGCRYVHKFERDEYYIFLLCGTIESYAVGSIGISNIVDLWMYLRRYFVEINWYYVKKIMKRMKIEPFGKRLEVLSYIWFGGGVMHGDDILIYEAMEDYVLTKGEKGREISSKMLPLIRQVADCYNRDRKREWVNKMHQWAFPKLEYMSTIYPVLNHVEWLLPWYWGLRLSRSTCVFLKGKLKKIITLFWSHMKKTVRR